MVFDPTYKLIPAKKLYIRSGSCSSLVKERIIATPAIPTGSFFFVFEGKRRAERYHY